MKTTYFWKTVLNKSEYQVCEVMGDDGEGNLEICYIDHGRFLHDAVAINDVELREVVLSDTYISELANIVPQHLKNCGVLLDQDQLQEIANRLERTLVEIFK